MKLIVRSAVVGTLVGYLTGAPFRPAAAAERHGGLGGTDAAIVCEVVAGQPRYNNILLFPLVIGDGDMACNALANWLYIEPCLLYNFLHNSDPAAPGWALIDSTCTPNSDTFATGVHSTAEGYCNPARSGFYATWAFGAGHGGVPGNTDSAIDISDSNFVLCPVVK